MSTIYRVCSGFKSVWFPDESSARAYARKLYEQDDDGIPFIDPVELPSVEHIVTLLNLVAGGSNERRSSLNDFI